MNHGKSVIGIRLMLLRDYLQANTGVSIHSDFLGHILDLMPFAKICV